LTASQRLMIRAATVVPAPVMQRIALLIMKLQSAPKQSAQESENHG